MQTQAPQFGPLEFLLLIHPLHLAHVHVCFIKRCTLLDSISQVAVNKWNLFSIPCSHIFWINQWITGNLALYSESSKPAELAELMSVPTSLRSSSILGIGFIHSHILVKSSILNQWGTSNSHMQLSGVKLKSLTIEFGRKSTNLQINLQQPSSLNHLQTPKVVASKTIHLAHIAFTCDILPSYFWPGHVLPNTNRCVPVWKKRLVTCNASKVIYIMQTPGI